MKKILFAALIVAAGLTSYAQKQKTDANIIGHVACNGEHIPFANVYVKGTTIGTTTDETGHFHLINLPVGSEITLEAKFVGYKTQSVVLTLNADETREVKFELEEDALALDEVVVSANRAEQKRVEAPVIVNTISPKLFATSQSVTLSEGLNFSPGLRMENNCQNCGFSQVRMNGMEGAYSQVLINSRPIFSGLASVYGLELIPANTIERVEVIRGGGSALYGSSAIAGTVNIIMKDPTANSYEVGGTYSSNGVGVKRSAGSAPDYSVNFNTSLVSGDSRTGVALYGFVRDRKMFDANNDSFSEIAQMKNQTIGTRFFHKFGARNKITADFFSIKEKREGGNMHNYPLHEREIAEAVEHDMKNAALTYEMYFRENDLLSVYASGQFLDRNSYYGANRSLQDYGFSQDRTYNVGANYNMRFENSSLMLGVENTTGFLIDKKLGYPDIDFDNDTIIHTPNTTIADQMSSTTGAFAQYDITINKLKLAVGGRFDHYRVKEHSGSSTPVSGNVFSPRLSVMYGIFKELQARVNYSQGFRAPQIFNEDMHVECSGARRVETRNSPNLKQETSHSFMASLDFNGLIGTTYTGILVEGFYTMLKDPFVNELVKDTTAAGYYISTRRNSESGATVKGINMELRLRPLRRFMLTSGFTVQRSMYDDFQPNVFEGDKQYKEFFRTPNTYGFASIDWDFAKGFCLSATGNYTGPMLVPYHGTQCSTDENGDPIGQMRTSRSFFDMGAKLQYTFRLNGAKMQLFVGAKNILNSYQNDFDTSVNLDPSYIYGPTLPRTLYFGIKIGNMLK